MAEPNGPQNLDPALERARIDQEGSIIAALIYVAGDVAMVAPESAHEEALRTQAREFLSAWMHRKLPTLEQMPRF